MIEKKLDLPVQVVIHVAEPGLRTWCGQPPDEETLSPSSLWSGPMDICPDCARWLLGGTTAAEEEALFQTGLMALAEQLVGSARGSSDPISRVERVKVTDYLTYRAHTWKPHADSGDEALVAYDRAAWDRIAAAVRLAGAK